MIEITNVIDNWVHGFIDGLSFVAQVFDKPSRFGINGGKISRLSVDKNKVCEYDRGWGKKTNHAGVLKLIAWLDKKGISAIRRGKVAI